MAVRKANESLFSFVCGALPASTFSIKDFSGVDTISSGYEFTIYLTSDKADIAADEIINQQATLYMYRQDQWYPYSGIVTEFSYCQTNVDYSTYEVVLVPKLKVLDLNFQNKIFQKITLPDVVTKVFEDNKMSQYITMKLTGKYPEREFVVQYQETDLNFVNRLLEECGIWYFFKEDPVGAEASESVSNEKLIITDKPDEFPDMSGESELAFRTNSGMHEMTDSGVRESVWHLSTRKRVLTKEVMVKNYNYRTPEVDLSSKTKVESGQSGTLYTYGQEFKDVSSAETIAKVASEKLGIKYIEVNGKSNSIGLKAGYKFTLKDHVRDDCNDTFLIQTVHHTGGHAHVSGRSKTYENVFEAIPSELAKKYRPTSTARIPKVSGVLSATIESQGSEYAALDEMGRYKVRLPFDVSDTKNYDASKYVRLAQPYSGADYGMHFPSHEGTEMLLACIDGNPNRIVGIGTIPNTNTITPVKNTNQTQSVIRTAGNNEMVFEDLDEKQKFWVETNSKNKLLMDDEAKRIQIDTTGNTEEKYNNQVLLDDTNEMTQIIAKKHVIQLIYSKDDQSITIQSEGNHSIKIDDLKNTITLQSEKGHHVQLDDDEQRISICDYDKKNKITLDTGNNGIKIESTGSIEIKAGGDLKIDATNIKINANAALKAHAKTEMKFDASTISSEAKLAMNIQGTTLKASGTTSATFEGGMTNVMGSMVFIN